MARLTFVVGKGGVGKTTVSCGLALHLAARHPRRPALLLSTDPAHSLADMLEIKLGAAPRKVVGARGQLRAWQIDSGKEFDKFLSRNREGVLSVVESGTFFNREEVAPLLDTTLPGMAEVAGLLAIQGLLERGEYEHIVVDTAPFGHTLRLFELPGHFQRFLDFLEVASSRDELLARRFGGRVDRPAHEFLERWQRTVREVEEAFSSRNAEIVLVTTAERFSLHEAVRCLRSLEKSAPEMRLGAIVLNRVVSRQEGCSRCALRAGMARKAAVFLQRNFPRTPRLLGPDPGNPMLGVRLLRRFGDAVFRGKAGKLQARPPGQSGQKRKAEGRDGFTLEKGAWPEPQTRLNFTAGKGGVGKTTTTAALAFRARRARADVEVTVCSTDPAPSLDDVFEKEIGNSVVPVLGDPGLGAMEIDSVAEFRRWAARMKEKLDLATSMESGGLHVDLTFEKQVFAALMEVVPPGIDEVFAIFRILDLLDGHAGEGERRRARSGTVFIDMAPTGHALELLRLPERLLRWSRLLLKSLAAHRTLSLAQDVAVELATLGQRIRGLLELLRDPGQSRAWVVMLPEPVPDRQTRRLLAALKELGMTVDSVFINRVLVEAEPRCERCSLTRAWQRTMLGRIRQGNAGRQVFVLPEFPDEIAGTAALKRFTGKIWQIQNQK